MIEIIESSENEGFVCVVYEGTPLAVGFRPKDYNDMSMLHGTDVSQELSKAVGFESSVELERLRMISTEAEVINAVAEDVKCAIEDYMEAYNT